MIEIIGLILAGLGILQSAQALSTSEMSDIANSIRNLKEADKSTVLKNVYSQINKIGEAKSMNTSRWLSYVNDFQTGATTQDYRDAGQQYETQLATQNKKIAEYDIETEKLLHSITSNPAAGLKWFEKLYVPLQYKLDRALGSTKDQMNTENERIKQYYKQQDLKNDVKDKGIRYVVDNSTKSSTPVRSGNNNPYQLGLGGK